uniref:Uncharacterized protein n=1 Tax=Oryza barthii TaxID=65489 RepID=A0A0D3FGS8_9ORYZ
MSSRDVEDLVYVASRPRELAARDISTKRGGASVAGARNGVTSVVGARRGRGGGGGSRIRGRERRRMSFIIYNVITI